MQKKLTSIIRMFPDFEEKINFLFQTDENFRDLCADHLLCVGMVQEMKKEKNKNFAKIAEYEELQQDLEQEILTAISK